MVEIIIGVLALGLGLALMILCADRAVKHAALLATSLGLSPLMIGLLLVSVGTDLPEIVNSIESCALGHADLDVGDSMGSVFAQLTLVLGLLPILGHSFPVRRKQILVMGTCLLLALGQVIAIVEKGYITRPNALILVGSWPLYMLLTRATEHAPPIDEFVPTEEAQNRWYSGLVTVVGLVGVAGGAYVVIQAVIRLSTNLHVPEYFISFFAVSIGTSMPELCVDLAALRRKEYQIVMGDIFGSCIVDATLSIGIGQVFFPQEISGALALSTVDYMLLATLIVVAALSWRRTVDRKAGVLFIVLYLLSYAFLFI